MKLIKTYLILLLAFFLVGFYFVKDDDNVIGVFNDDYFKSTNISIDIKPYETEYVYNSDVEDGKTKVIRDGVDGYSIVDGDYQLLWLDEETEKSGQWIPTSDYPLSFSEFKVSTDSAENLASAFLKNFERAGIEVESTRRQNALKWFNYIKDLSPWLPINTSRRKTLPVWMMC